MDTNLLQQCSSYSTSHLYLDSNEFSLLRPTSLKVPKTCLFLWIRRITKLHKMTVMKRQRKPEDEWRENLDQSPLALRLRMGPSFQPSNYRHFQSNELRFD